MLLGFNNAIDESQKNFRKILLAVSEPGSQVTLEGTSVWSKLNMASVAVMLTLCDQNTGVYLSPELSDKEAVKALQFHTQASISSSSKEAHFAFIKAAEFQADKFNYGNETYPEKSTTVVIQVQSLTHGMGMTLSGPGISGQKIITPQIPEELQEHYEKNTQYYPLGIDTILVCDRELISIPRSTTVLLSAN